MTDSTIPEVVMESGWYYTDAGQYVQVWRITQDGGCWCSDMKYHCASTLYTAPPNAPADAEAKTVPVPTHVHLIGETAVIAGTPGRGWDEDAQDAHNCDDMGCPTIGPHVLARVPFTDEREKQKT